MVLRDFSWVPQTDSRNFPENFPENVPNSGRNFPFLLRVWTAQFLLSEPQLPRTFRRGFSRFPTSFDSSSALAFFVPFAFDSSFAVDDE